MNGLILAAQVDRVATRKDRSVSIVLETQELTPAKAGELLSVAHKLVCVYISPKETIDQREIDQVDQIDPEFGGKTQSQRLRNTLFVLWQQVPDGFKDFDSYYHNRMEALIEKVKAKIPA